MQKLDLFCFVLPYPQITEYRDILLRKPLSAEFFSGFRFRSTLNTIHHLITVIVLERYGEFCLIGVGCRGFRENKK